MTLIIFMYLFSLFYSVLVVLTTVCEPKSLSGTIRNIHSIQRLNSRWHVLEPLTPSFGSTRLQTVQLHWTDLKRATLFIKLTEVLQLLPSQPSKKKRLKCWHVASFSLCVYCARLFFLVFTVRSMVLSRFRFIEFERMRFTHTFNTSQANFPAFRWVESQTHTHRSCLTWV